jgi:gamma-glutamyltranspeptidase
MIRYACGYLYLNWPAYPRRDSDTYYFVVVDDFGNLVSVQSA